MYIIRMRGRIALRRARARLDKRHAVGRSESVVRDVFHGVLWRARRGHARRVVRGASRPVRFRAFISPPYSLFFFLVKRIGRFGFGCCDCDVFSVRLTDGPDQLSPRDGVTNPQWRADGAARG
eukprot:30769-Pelagococcus_subviridis.AAC.2